MRYLVKARLRAEQVDALAKAIRNRTLGRGSIAGDEYLYNMETASTRKARRIGWKRVFATRRSLKSVHIGRNISTCCRLRMHIRAAIAGMKMGPNLGRVATAIARSGWKKNWHEVENPFCRVCARSNEGTRV
jgi:hypothetical protein